MTFSGGSFEKSLHFEGSHHSEFESLSRHVCKPIAIKAGHHLYNTCHFGSFVVLGFLSPFLLDILKQSI